MKDIGVESVHRARVLIYQRHIRVGQQVVASPGYLVREKSAVKIRCAFPPLFWSFATVHPQGILCGHRVQGYEWSIDE